MDLTNQKFGEWTALYPIKKNNIQYWHCRCDCGVEKDVSQCSLRNGRSQSCGHNNKKGKSFKDYSGQKIGHLTIIRQTNERRRNSIVWECLCDCGNTCYFSSEQLKIKKILDCGCSTNPLRRIGEKYGKLTIKKLVPAPETTTTRGYFYLCECECGNECVVNSSDLINGKQISCGCVKSIGEFNIIQCLKNNNINFSKEYTFNDLKDKHLLRFDFAIFDNNNNLIRLIEFDGEQHHQKDNLYFSLTNCEHDKIKNEYAKEHNIPLVRIPYQLKNEINLDIIMGDQYLV